MHLTRAGHHHPPHTTARTGVCVSFRSPGDNGPNRLELLRTTLSGWKPRIVRWLLGLVALLGVAAEVIDPLGDALKGQQLLGGSFAALMALILFDAIGESEPKEVSGVHVFAKEDELHAAFREAFTSRVVRIDFSGFTMQTLLAALRAPLETMADNEVHTVELKLYIIIAHTNLPMGLPGGLAEVPGSSESGHRMYYFRDGPENRERMRDRFTTENWNTLREWLEAVHRRNPRIIISCEIRESPQIPERKLYILNQETVFSTPYGIKHREIEWKEKTHQILDAEGYAPLYGRARYVGWDLRSTALSTRQIAEHHMECHRNLWEKLADIKPEYPVITDPLWATSHR
ncbi:hypothetical protein ACGFYV_30580 [Streptomyces sp. NPDC048297]|uniref:hypothetical protein n=1 Tax=Streptomyces sp. NPDC048297 TaxID=3365531 RepID=UPI00371A1F28